MFNFIDEKYLSFLGPLLGAGAGIGLFYFIKSKLQSLVRFLYSIIRNLFTDLYNVNTQYNVEEYSMLSEILSKEGELILTSLLKPATQIGKFNSHNFTGESLPLGNFYMRYDGFYLYINHEEQTKENTCNAKNIDITVYFDYYKKFKEEINQKIKSKIKVKNSWYISEGGGHTRNLEKYSAPFIHKNIFSDIIKDLNLFLESKDLYNYKHKTWKSVYILVGPPGSGKTSLIRSICQNLEKPIMNLALEDLIHSYLLNDRVYLIEDFDRQEINFGQDLSKLLNILDGLNSPNGSIFFSNS